MVRTTSVTKSHNIFQTDVICRKYYVHDLIFIHGYMYNQGLLLLGITICCYDLVQHAVFKSRRNSFAGCHVIMKEAMMTGLFIVMGQPFLMSPMCMIRFRVFYM